LTGFEIFAHLSPTISGQYLVSVDAEDPPLPNFFENGFITLLTETAAVGAGLY
jgi:hypothetical protein